MFGSGMQRASVGRCAAAAALLGAFAVAPLALARAASGADYLAHGYRIRLLTVLPNTFTGCTKDKAYTFADGSVFVCKTRRSAFQLNPRVEVLVSGDGAATAVLIADRAYAGSLILIRNGQRLDPIAVSAEAPASTAEAAPPMAVGAVRPIEPIEPILALPDDRKLQSDAVQSYPVRPHATPP